MHAWLKKFIVERFSEFVKTHSRAECYQLIETVWCEEFRGKFGEYMLKSKEHTPDEWRQVYCASIS